MIRPTKSNVLIKRLMPPNKSTGGIFIPTSGTEDMQSKFRVMAVGPEFKEVCVGQCVFTNTYSGTEIEHAGQKYRLVEGSSILAVLVHE